MAQSNISKMSHHNLDFISDHSRSKMIIDLMEITKLGTLCTGWYTVLYILHCTITYIQHSNIRVLLENEVNCALGYNSAL